MNEMGYNPSQGMRSPISSNRLMGHFLQLNEKRRNSAFLAKQEKSYVITTLLDREREGKILARVMKEDSVSGGGEGVFYDVDLTERSAECTCPDYVRRRVFCKHIGLVCLELIGDGKEVGDETEKEKGE